MLYEIVHARLVKNSILRHLLVQNNVEARILVGVRPLVPGTD